MENIFELWFISLRCECRIDILHSLIQGNFFKTINNRHILCIYYLFSRLTGNLKRINRLCPRTEESPLSIAVKKGSSEMIRLLCDLGADPDMKCMSSVIGQTYKTTPLLLARYLAHVRKRDESLRLLCSVVKNKWNFSLQIICLKRIRFLLREKYGREERMNQIIRSFHLTQDAKNHLTNYYLK
uniref:Uncharacterized protein n=1 Tax=Lepeophtheirus salmonis TaxID=72036 RepID=A0A0K2UJ05_LEPSM